MGNGSPSTIGLRVPDHAAARRLIELSGGLILATSANPAGGEEARTAEEVRAALGAWVEMILDGGPLGGGRASTVIEVSEADEITVLRAGALAAEEVLGAARP